MDGETRGFMGTYGQLLKEWCVASFCAASLDWVASKVPVRNGIFATLISIGQLSAALLSVNAIMGLFSGAPDRLYYYTDTWLSYNTILIMSPTAVSRLSNSYKKLHFILYGPGKIPSGTNNCPSGNCGTSNIAQSDQKALPQRELADTTATQAMTMTQRIVASKNKK